MIGCFSLLILITAIAALVVVLRGNERLRAVKRRMDVLEQAFDSFRRAGDAAVEGQQVAQSQQKAAGAEVSEPFEPAEPTDRELPPGGFEPGEEEEEVPNLPRAEQDASGFQPISTPSRARPRWTTWSIKDLEKSLGARLPVWIGAVALILSGAFLVKVSFERGWLVPQLRVAFGIIFGGVLLGAGEWLRKPAYRIAQGLSAAGIAVLFVSFYAGVNLYHLISPAAGFGFMALTAAVAVVLSLRQGAMVAVLGLVGGFVTPQLVQAGEPDPRLLFVYLLLLQAGLLAVARKKSWPGLAAVGYCGGLIWLGIWLLTTFEAEHSLWLGLFVVASAGLFVGATLVTHGETPWETSKSARWLTRVTLVGGLAGLGALTVRADFQVLDWAFVGLLGAGCLVLARIKEEFHPFAWVAAGATALLFALWIGSAPAVTGGRLLATAVAFGLLFGAGGYIAHRGSKLMASWCTLSAASGTVFLLLAYWGAQELDLSIPWGLVSLVIGGLYAAAAVPLFRQRSHSMQLEQALAALAVGATSAISLAVPMQLERSSLAVAWALEVTALVWLAGRLGVPVLRTLAWIAGVLVTLHLVHPELVDLNVGNHLVFNWLLFMYGIPFVAFSAAAYFAAQQGEEKLSEALQWGSIIFGIVLVSLEVRQYFRPGDVDATRLFFAERGALTIAWLALAWGLLRAAERWPLRSLTWGGTGLGGVALAYAIFDQGLIANPAWRHFAVGDTPIFNALLWVYGLSAILMLVLARKLADPARKWLGRALNCGALVNCLLLVTLEVRQAFRGSYLDRGTASPYLSSL